jgi:hypothetical protein
VSIQKWLSEYSNGPLAGGHVMVQPYRRPSSTIKMADQKKTSRPSIRALIDPSGPVREDNRLSQVSLEIYRDISKTGD